MRIQSPTTTDSPAFTLPASSSTDGSEKGPIRHRIGPFSCITPADLIVPEPPGPYSLGRLDLDIRLLVVWRHVGVQAPEPLDFILWRREMLRTDAAGLVGVGRLGLGRAAGAGLSQPQRQRGPAGSLGRGHC